MTPWTGVRSALLRNRPKTKSDISIWKHVISPTEAAGRILSRSFFFFFFFWSLPMDTFRNDALGFAS